ncbi:hypothetical protein GCM10027160_37240 [Streptomyces calidiresistens]
MAVLSLRGGLCPPFCPSAPGPRPVARRTGGGGDPHRRRRASDRGGRGGRRAPAGARGGEEDVLALVRFTRTAPGPRAVRLRAHDEAEEIFARAPTERAERLGEPVDPLRIRAGVAMINEALRAAVEHHAREVDGSGEPLVSSIRRAPLTIAEGLSDPPCHSRVHPGPYPGGPG